MNEMLIKARNAPADACPPHGPLHAMHSL
jgi:hypothetical protein